MLCRACCWQLAIGTGKGSLLLYDHNTGIRTMASAKHKKRVVCADWSGVGNVVAFASEDKQARHRPPSPPDHLSCRTRARDFTP